MATEYEETSSHRSPSTSIHRFICPFIQPGWRIRFVYYCPSLMLKGIPPLSNPSQTSLLAVESKQDPPPQSKILMYVLFFLPNLLRQPAVPNTHRKKSLDINKLSLSTSNVVYHERLVTYAVGSATLPLSSSPKFAYSNRNLGCLHSL